MQLEKLFAKFKKQAREKKRKNLEKSNKILKIQEVFTEKKLAKLVKVKKFVLVTCGFGLDFMKSSKISL